VVQTASRIAMIALCLCLAASAQSATWHVEKDGSGDFEVIQDAVDAAAPGDVIMVGPGRYEEFQVWNNGNQDWHIYVLVETDDLTSSHPETHQPIRRPIRRTPAQESTARAGRPQPCCTRLFARTWRPT